MNNLIIGIRAQDFHECLRVTGSFGPKDVHYKKTLLIGKAASLAMHLRGLLFIENVQQLEYAASSLGISSLELPVVLHELEEVDFISVVKTGDEIKRVDIRVPEFRSGYEDLGERWTQLKPSVIEQASLSALETLHYGPVSEEKLRKNLGLGATDFAILNDVMKSGQLLVIQPVDGNPVAFTPLAVDGNPNAYLQWAKNFPAEVQAAIGFLRQQQGVAVDDPKLVTNPALLDAISTGVLMPVQVDGGTGKKQFVFAPRGGLNPEERVILDKARAIQACVRYGQKYAAGCAIIYPRSIVNRLRTFKRFKKGHPGLFTQYGLLVEKLIGEPVDEGGGRWNFQVFDNPENIKALDIAAEGLETGESPSAHIDLNAQKTLMSATGYLGPSTTRPQLVTQVQASSETRTEIIRQMANLARGSTTNV